MARLARFVIVIWIGLLPCAPAVADAQSTTDKRLLQKTNVQFVATPVKDVIRELGEKHKLPVEFAPVVDAEGHGTAPFSLTADGITLASALNLACQSAGLVYTVEKGRLLVTTQTADEGNLIVREYPIATLGPLAADPQVLANVLQVTSGALWKDLDGAGGEFVAISRRSITIRQSRETHQELQDWFDQLAAAATGRARAPSVQDRTEQVLLRKLQAVGSIPAGEVALPDFLDQLLRMNGVPYWVDLPALAEQGVMWTDLKTVVADKKLSPAARLDAALGEHKLAWRVGDEVVQITTLVKANEQLFARVYDVRRAISPNRSIASLVDQIKANKDLGPWEDVDGKGGSIAYLSTVLIVRHNAAAHSRLAALLK